MKSIFLIAFISLIFISQTATAMCSTPIEQRAMVTVLECMPVTYSKTDWLNIRQTLKGNIIKVRIIDTEVHFPAQLKWEGNLAKRINSFRVWIPNSIHEFFIDDEDNNVCKIKLPIDTKIITVNGCCDTGYNRACYIPNDIEEVKEGWEYEFISPEFPQIDRHNLDRQWKLVVKRLPVFPNKQLTEALCGEVIAKFNISNNGLPIGIKITSTPNSLLSDEVMKVLPDWKFIPQITNGSPEIVDDLIISFNFNCSTSNVGYKFVE